MWINIVMCVVLLMLAASALICAINKTPFISHSVTYYNHPKSDTEQGDD